MNYRQIEYAIMLSKTLNFSLVAEELGLTQPTLSKQIQSLEKELGIKIFDRNHVPMRITPAGEFFLSEAKEIIYKESELKKQLEGFKKGERGRLVIGVTPFRSLCLMPAMIKTFKEKYPEVEIVLYEAQSETLRKNAVEGKFDFAVVNLPVDESVLDVRTLEADELVLAVPEGLLHLLDSRVAKSDEIKDFSAAKKLPFVVLSERQELRVLFDKFCVNAGFKPNITAEVVSVSTAWAMASGGCAAALLPMQIIKSGRFGEGLKLFKIKDISYSRQPVIVTKRGQYLSEYAKYAIDILSIK